MSSKINLLFTGNRAEDEIGLLFAGSAFWPHPVWGELNESSGVRFVWGKAGTGKTALAYALGQYLHSSKTFACYVQNGKNLQAMEQILARKLIKFIATHLTFLSELTKDQRTLLAKVLTSRFSADVTVLYLTTDTDALNLLRLPSSPESGRLKSSATRQLTIFKKIIATSFEKPLPETEWGIWFLECIKWFGFSRLRLVMDLEEEILSTKLQEDIMSGFQSWDPRKFQLLVFTSNNQIFERVIHETITPLQWNTTLVQTPLREMLEWRWRSFKGKLRERRIEFDQIISEETLEKLLVVAQANPRRLFQVWRRIVELDETNGLTRPELVAQANAMLGT